MQWKAANEGGKFRCPGSNRLLLITLLLLAGFSQQGTSDVQAADPLPSSRPFYMGFTPQPYDISDKAYTKTYRVNTGISSPITSMKECPGPRRSLTKTVSTLMPRKT